MAIPSVKFILISTRTERKLDSSSSELFSQLDASSLF